MTMKDTQLPLSAGLELADRVAVIDDPDGVPDLQTATLMQLQEALLTIGATGPWATAGDIRSPNAGASWRFRGSAGLDVYALQAINDSVFIGCDSTFSPNQPSALYLFAVGGGQLSLGLGGSTFVHMYNGIIEHWKPITGSGIGSSPYAVHGRGQALPLDADYTVLAAQYMFYENWFRPDAATSTALHLLVYPHPASEAGSYTKLINNTCGFARTITTGTGTTRSLANLKKQLFSFTPDGVENAGFAVTP